MKNYPALAVLALLTALFANALHAQDGPPPDPLDATRIDYDPSIPTLEAVVGHAFGERMSTHADTERYVLSLAQNAARATHFRYGESWEGRALHYLVVGSPDNLARLDAVRTGMQQLASGRPSADFDTDALIDSLPSVCWIAASVHGDETSCTDAALRLAYHLTAARNDSVVDEILAQSLVIVDPLVNPDGRERFVQHFRQNVGAAPDSSPDAIEHDQPWPGGRSNHYLFDMNRDWFAMTQPETRARVAAFQQWWPIVYVDAHEMGSNSTFYFPPPAAPILPEIGTQQQEWLSRYGQNNARWFDAQGYDYFTRESFDAFYPGYGDCWPLLNGVIGMTFEQAAVRGLVVRRRDETELRYSDAVDRHFVAALATAQTAAQNRGDALRAFWTFRSGAVSSGATRPVKEFVFPPRGDLGRIHQLVSTLRAQGIEVQRAEAALTSTAARPLTSEAEPTETTFAPGSYVVSLAQPSQHLAAALLSRHFDMPQEFLDEQIAKEARRDSTAFYDMTGWSLPLLYGVECYTCASATTGDRSAVPVDPPRQTTPSAPPAANVAYLMPWSGNDAARALVDLLRTGVRARSSDKTFKIGGVDYPRGTVVIPAKQTDSSFEGDLVALLTQTVERHGVTITATDTSWVEDGVNFGSNAMHALRAPRVALAWDDPTRSTAAGATRFLLERSYGCPVTLIRTQRIGRADLARFDVLVLPHGGGYSRALGSSGADSIKRWVRAGGTLITLGGATRWLTEDDVALLATAREDRDEPRDADAATDDSAADPPGAKAAESRPSSNASEDGGFNYDRAILPDRERPARTPGAILNVSLDPEHWLTAGYGAHAHVVTSSQSIYTPVKLDAGRNIAVYAPRDDLLASGFTWQHALDQLAEKAYLVHQPHGRGHVIAFAEDPTVRAFAHGLQLLLMNAVLLGPCH